jgi:IS30 family transposase
VRASSLRASVQRRGGWSVIHETSLSDLVRQTANHKKSPPRTAPSCIVGEQLKHKWSPQQIAGWLKTTQPDDPEMQVSHGTIYRTLFIESPVACARSSLHICGLGG